MGHRLPRRVGCLSRQLCCCAHRVVNDKSFRLTFILALQGVFHSQWVVLHQRPEPHHQLELFHV